VSPDVDRLCVLVVDNYDSFVFNLVQYLAQLGADVVVRRNDDVTTADIESLGVQGILLSPGPGRPEDAGICVEATRTFAGRIPILGVCLGHQAIAVAYGGEVVRAPELLPGKTSLVHHRGDGVLRGLPSPFTATRYHSLSVADGVPAELTVTATTESGVIMAMRHTSAPVEGVQFHPESVLTEGGHLLLANWLGQCGDSGAVSRAPAFAAALERQRVPAG
jgi:para-aminobenzoate synthetase component II